MRLWSIHPRYLDSKGIVALWREALLAKKVLEGKTKGYLNHPQLIRFRKLHDPLSGIGSYLEAVYAESRLRHYNFNKRKIGVIKYREILDVTDGQLEYEWAHLKKKLWKRDRRRFYILKEIRNPDPHPLFRRKIGGIEGWEVL